MLKMPHQSIFLVIALSFFCLMQDSTASYLVASKVGSCYHKKAYGIIRMRKFECENMGGLWNGAPTAFNWINCHLDWCEIPAVTRRLSRDTAWHVCEARDQRSGGGRFYGIVRMKWSECSVMNGKVNGSPKPQEWTDCHLYWCAFNGNKNNIHAGGIVAASLGSCGKGKVAYGIIRMVFSECKALGGAWNGSPQPKAWTDCHLDWCIF